MHLTACTLTTLVTSSAVGNAPCVLHQQQQQNTLYKTPNLTQQAMSVSITWSDLTYTVPVRVGRAIRKRGTKVVLEKVSGHVPPERLLAIMGPTGTCAT